MHSSISSLGGDLKTDTVAIIGATLDLQEKVVKQVRIPVRSSPQVMKKVPIRR